MHVARIRSAYTDKQGQRREYESRYLRRSYRDGGKVRHETLGNLSGLPEAMIDSIEAVLKGTALVPAARAVTILRSLPHGHVAAVHAMAVKLGLPALLGPACPERDLALALIISRVVAPASKLSTLTWWDDTTLGADLGAAAASAGRIYAAMDWLERRQDAIEAKLARRHLAPDANPSKMALFDLSSSWLEGRHCPLAARGYSRDGRKGKLQIEYGLLTDPAGRPVAVRVFPGNTGDPGAFTAIVDVVRKKFALEGHLAAGHSLYDAYIGRPDPLANQSQNSITYGSLPEEGPFRIRPCGCGQESRTRLRARPRAGSYPGAHPRALRRVSSGAHPVDRQDPPAPRELTHPGWPGRKQPCPDFRASPGQPAGHLADHAGQSAPTCPPAFIPRRRRPGWRIIWAAADPGSCAYQY